MTEEQMMKLRQSLVDGLTKVVEDHRVDVGGGLSCSDVMGALEWVKLEVYIEAKGDDLLYNTYMASI
jgi:hypothetical protein